MHSYANIHMQTKISLAANNFYTSWEYFFPKANWIWFDVGFISYMFDLHLLYPIAIFSTPAIPLSTHVIASLATSRDVVGTPEIG